MPIETWLSFVVVWSALVAFPGPSVAYAVAAASRHGRPGAVYAALGFAFAVMIYVALVAAGLIAFLAASAGLFEVVRWVGTAYLFYLAWQFWRARPAASASPNQAARPVMVFVRATLVALTNPKSAMVYVLIYPTFVDPALDAATQLALLCATSVVLSFAIYLLYGLLGEGARALLRTPRAKRMGSRGFSAIFFSAGLALAFSARR